MDVLVSYTDVRDKSQTIQDRVLRIEPKASANELIQEVKGMIRPYKPADPSDGYKGSCPTQITIVSISDLSSMLTRSED